MTSTPPVRITVISQLPPPVHGVTIMTQTLIRVLSTDRLDVRFVDRRFSRSVAEVGVFQIRKAFALIGFWARLLWSLIVSRPAAIILFGTNREFSLISDVGVAFLSRLFNIRLINYVHSVGYRRLSARRGFSPLISYVLRTSTLTVCLGQKLADDVTPWVDQDTIRLVPNATAALPHTAQPKRQFLFLSNLIREKGVDDFIELAVRLCLQDPDVEFAIAGSIVDQDEHTARVSLVHQLELQDRIRFVGSVGGDAKTKLIAESTALVFPSQYPLEAQPLTIIEAMSLAVPVVAYDIGGIGDLVGDGESGFLVPPGDIDALVERAALVHNDDIIHTALKNGAHTRYEAHHSLASFTARWNDIVREATATRNSA